MTVAAMREDEVESGGEQEFEVRLLGPVQAVHQGRAVELGGVQARSVLAVLMLLPGQVVPRTTIIRNAWRTDPPATAHDLVTGYVSRLRSALAPAAAQVRLESVRPGFRAGIDAGLIDAHRFAALARQAGQDRAAGEDDLAIVHLEQALALWRGHTLALEDVEAEWLRAQASALQDQRFLVLEQLAVLYRGTDQPSRAVHLLRPEAPRHPQRDRLIATLVQALTDTGQGALAVEVADRAQDALDQSGLPVGALLREARRRAQLPRKPSSTPGSLRQLLPDSSVFTGRESELAELMDLAETVRGTHAGAVVISAIDGMAGVGKTALAVRAGHRLIDRFPDGQLFIDLHGFAQGLEPRTAIEVLADVLRVLGVPPQQIPQDLDARAASYRDRISGKRLLVVLDNALNEEQVRPLLPGHPGCLVLVTSRRRLKGLDEARVMSLDVLPVPDALALLRTVAGPGRIPPDDPLLEQIAQLCGRLPLALRIAAALLRHRPSWSLAHLAGRLRETGPALAGFHDGDRDLAAVFDLSYTALSPGQRRLFRHLGLHPGPDIDRDAAAALIDTGPLDADALLQSLVDHSLLTETAPGRYLMHDLIRAHAHALSSTDPECEAGLDRLLRYYSHTAQTASLLTALHPGPAADGPAPGHSPAFLDPEGARSWLRTERSNLDAAFTYAHHHGMDGHAIALAGGLAEILQTDGPWTRALEIHSAAATIAERRGNSDAYANALNRLGRVRHLTGEYAGACEALSRALNVFGETGNRLGEASALADLGRTRYLTGDYGAARDALTRALDVFRALGSPLGEAGALNNLGRVRHLTGDFPGAGDAHLRALEIYRAIGNRSGEAGALADLGLVRYLTGDFPGAGDVQIRALEIYCEIGNRLGEANALNNLGRVRKATGDHAGAIDFNLRALEIYRAIGNRSGAAYALTELGRVRHLTGDYPGALDVHDQALDAFRALGNRSGEAGALTDIGRVQKATGDHAAAIDFHLRALEIYRAIGSRDNEAWALNYYAEAVAAGGEQDRALALYQQALTMNRELSKPDDEGVSLEGIAEHHLATGDIRQGAEHLGLALEIYQRLGMRADTDRVQNRLTALDAR